MHQFSAQPARMTGPHTPSFVETPQGGHWLLVARACWIMLTLLLLTLNVVMLPRYDALLQARCQKGTPCLAIHLTAYDWHLMHQLGISLGFLASYQVVLNAIIVVVNCVLGALIFWRKSADRMALFCAFMLVLFGGVGWPTILLDTLMPASPVWFVLIGTLMVLGQSCFCIFFLLFPSGRFVPSWTCWVAVCVVLYWIYTDFSANIFFTASTWSNLVLFALLLCIVAAQVYRYLRVSTPRERQQTRWVLFSLCVSIVGFVVFIGLGNALLPPVVLQSGVSTLMVADTVVDGLLLLIPISIALAILRSRLYEIDSIINRTLVYGLLSGLLVAIYVGLTIGLEGLMGWFSGQTSQPVVVILSTLAIAALFQPLRQRIQTLIDRRFFRQKYDAQKALAAFGAALRNEVDLEQLCEHLLAIARETMQPAQISLWLRPIESRPGPPFHHREEFSQVSPSGSDR